MLRHRRPYAPTRGAAPWTTVGLCVSLAALLASCFDGADALGLPCDADQDCGQGQSCEQGFCGGPPATSSGSGSESSSSTLDSSGAETSPGTRCGDGEVSPELGEECDPGIMIETPLCNSDCTMTRCGDGYTNEVAGEGCDDGNDDNLDACTTACRQTLFWDDLSQDPLASGEWTADTPSHTSEDDMSAFMLSSGWQWGVPEAGVWNSGAYSVNPGTARIMTRPIMFPPDPGPGFQYELRYRHRLRFDGNPMDIAGTPCEGDPLNGDGGVVMIVDGPGPARPVGPPMGHTDMLDDEGMCVANLNDPANPLYDEGMPRPAYTGISAPMVDVQLVLPDVAGQSVQLVFEVGYDCANCWENNPPAGAGWTIDDVVVAAFPMGGG